MIATLRVRILISYFNLSAKILIIRFGSRCFGIFECCFITDHRTGNSFCKFLLAGFAVNVFFIFGIIDITCFH